MIKKGEIVVVMDNSYNFGVQHDSYRGTHGVFGDPLRVVEIGLSVMKDPLRNSTTGEFCAICDLLVTDERGGFWFVSSRLVKQTKKKIEVRFVCDGEDVTDDMSEETKKAILAKQ